MPPPKLWREEWVGPHEQSFGLLGWSMPGGRVLVLRRISVHLYIVLNCIHLVRCHLMLDALPIHGKWGGLTLVQLDPPSRLAGLLCSCIVICISNKSKHNLEDEEYVTERVNSYHRLITVSIAALCYSGLLGDLHRHQTANVGLIMTTIGLMCNACAG